MKTLLFLCLFALSYGSIEDAMLVISGASCIEELTEDAVSMFAHYAEHPIDLNAASERRLVSSGLMSSYQAASLCEYRKRSGDVLSWQELAFVDGFSSRYAHALESFAVLRQRGAPRAVETDGIRGDITLSEAPRFRQLLPSPTKSLCDSDMGSEPPWSSRANTNSCGTRERLFPPPNLESGP